MGTGCAGAPEASILDTVTGCAWSWYARSLKLQFWVQGPGTQCLWPQCPVMLGPGTRGAGTAIRCCHVGVPEALGPGVWQLGARGPDGGEVQHGKSLWPAITTGSQQRGRGPSLQGWQASSSPRRCLVVAGDSVDVVVAALLASVALPSRWHGLRAQSSPAWECALQ